MSADTVLPSGKAPVEFLPVNLDYMTKELEIKAKTELLEDQNVRDQSLKLLRSLLEAEENLLWQNDDLFLLAFLRARKFDVKRAFNLIKGFYTSFGKCRDVCYRLNFDLRKRITEERIFSILPYRDSENSVIVILRCHPWDLQIFSVQELMIFLSFSLIQTLRSPSTQIAGFQLIADFKGYTMRHGVTTAPGAAKFFVDMIQKALPLRMKGFHIVNENHLFSYVWEFGKVFTSKKLIQRVHFHGNDMESLHKFFHPSLLPADLGGELKPSYDADWNEKMEASNDYIQHVLSHGYEKPRSKR